MKDRTKIRTGKRIMAVMLSLAMIFGIFSGMKLDAEAAGTMYSFDDLQVGKELYFGDTINFESKELDNPQMRLMSIVIRIYWSSDEFDFDGIYSSGELPKDRKPSYTIPTRSHDKIYSKYKIIKSSREPDYIMGVEFFVIYLTPLEDDKNGTLSESDSAASSSSIPSHTCNFQWVTTLDPTIGADGLEEYKCVGCGAVQESHPIPASVAAFKDFYGKVKDTPANGTVTYDSGKLYTISDYLLKKMSERSDVAVTINFEYQNAKYELTFPAGTDFTPALTDEETMYGYFGVAAKLGLTVVAK